MTAVTDFVPHLKSFIFDSQGAALLPSCHFRYSYTPFKSSFFLQFCFQKKHTNKVFAFQRIITTSEIAGVSELAFGLHLFQLVAISILKTQNYVEIFLSLFPKRKTL